MLICVLRSWGVMMRFEWVEFVVDDDMKRLASDYVCGLEKALKNKGLRNRFNSDWRENNLVGFVGELVFKKFLDGLGGVSYDWNVVVGCADDYDFLVCGKRVDVKTCLRNFPVGSIGDNFRLMVCDAQVGLHADFYFWVLLEGVSFGCVRRAFLVGGMSAERVGCFPVVDKSFGRTRWVGVDEVVCPNDFLFCLGD